MVRTQFCTWNPKNLFTSAWTALGRFRYSVMHLVVSIHCTLVVWRNYRALPPAATGGCSTSQFQLSNFLPRNCKVQYFRPDHDAWIQLSPKWCLWPLNPNWLLSNIKGRTPEGTWGTAKPRSNSKLLGSPDHQVNWLAGSVRNSNTWWISQKVDLYCPMLILDSHSKIR